MTNKYSSLFSPFMLTDKIKLRNRIVMAPMTTWSANPDGTISQQELEFYKRRSQKVPELTIPDKLWDEIQASRGTGWFPLSD